MDEKLGLTFDAGTRALPALPPLKLAVVGGPSEGAECPLSGQVVDVGSDPACQLVLDDRTVSRRHAQVCLRDGRVWVKDLGSKNGTLFGQVRLQEGEVPIGTVLKLGDSTLAVQMRWHVREVAPSAAHQFHDLVGQSLAMRELFAILERVAPTDVPVLVEGESGTGKEVTARSLHLGSRRAAGPYVAFDCASIPPELAESELFGHKKGAFSGAAEAREGAFVRAHGGTLFLDEIGELKGELQAKLLRVLETGEVRAVGADAPRKLDVRIIAATNRDLYAEAQRGNFRSDLWYRLEVVKVRLSPLRHRPEDIPRLVEKLLEGRLVAGNKVEGDNLKRLMSYGWPGNVRELRNVLHRALALSGAAEGAGRFESLVFNLGPSSPAPATIGAELPGVASRMSYKDAKAQLLESFDRAYVVALLKRNGNNVTRAAEEADLSRKHLYTLMRNLGVDEPAGDT